MTSIHAGARESVHMVGVPERIGALQTLVMSGLKPRLPVWQSSALSVGLCPSGMKNKLKSGTKKDNMS